MEPKRPAETLAAAQGAWFALTGLWPIAHLPSFEAVTGPKPEGWLVKVTGACIASIGGAVLLAGLRRRVTPEIALLAAGSAAALGFADVWYGGVKRRISPVYLLDAALEGAWVGLWAAAARRGLSRPAPAR